MANVAELEAGLISERTKAALAKSKKRLGRTGAETLAPKYRVEAQVRAEQLAPVIRELQRDGYSLNGIAAELEKRQGGNTARWRMAPAAREADRAADRCLISGPIRVLALLLGTKCWSLGHSPCRPTRENSNEEVCTGDFSCRLVL
jgi:hypothetical protein